MEIYFFFHLLDHLDRVQRIWYLSPMRSAKVQASLRICSVSPEPSLLAHTSSESRGTFRQKTRSLAPLNGWTCAVEICHDGMLEDTNSLDGAHFMILFIFSGAYWLHGTLAVPYLWAMTWQNQQNDCAPSEDSDQPGHSPSLIRVFAVRMKKAWVLSGCLGWSESSLGAHSFCWFCHVMAHMKSQFPAPNILLVKHKYRVKNTLKILWKVSEMIKKKHFFSGTENTYLL